MVLHSGYCSGFGHPTQASESDSSKISNDTVKYKGKTNSYPKSQNGNSSSNILRFGDKDEDHFLFFMTLHKNETFH